MVAESGDLPVVIYHNPALSKFNISPKFAGKLATIQGVVALKEVLTDLQHLDGRDLGKQLSFVAQKARRRNLDRRRARWRRHRATGLCKLRAIGRLALRHADGTSRDDDVPHRRRWTRRYVVHDSQERRGRA